jgi:cell division protein FtsW
MNARLDVELAGRSGGTDHILIANVLMLSLLGIVTLYSASYTFSARFMGGGLHLVSRQALLGAIGLLLFFIASRINLEHARKLIKPLVIGCIILCILTLVPGIGVIRNGAARWIGIGSWTYQPSELVKLVLPFYLAHFFDKKKDNIDILFRAGFVGEHDLVDFARVLERHKRGLGKGQTVSRGGNPRISHPMAALILAKGGFHRHP